MGNELRSRLEFLASIGIQVDPARVDAWVAELEAGNGRDLEGLWSDVLQHVVGGQRDAVAAWVTEAFAGQPVDPSRLDRLVNELISGTRTFQQMRGDIEAATGITSNTTGSSGDEDDIRLMGGPHQWFRTGDNWYIAYQAPGNQWVYFEVSNSEMDTIFGDGVRPVATQIRDERAIAQRTNFHYGGLASEVTGEGNFLAEANNALARALADGALPDWIPEGRATDEILGIIAVAQTQEKGQDWLIEQLARTGAFQQRFQGIDLFRGEGMSWLEAVGAYRQYESALNNMHRRRGDDIQVTPAQVATYLEHGHSVQDVQFIYESHDRLTQNASAFASFNDILVAQGRDPLTRRQQLEFMQGNAPADLYQLWENFSVLHAAREAGIGSYLSAQDAIRVAQATEGIETTASITESMQRAAALALRYRAQMDVTKYGITTEDIIDMSMGVVPNSGKTHAELTQIMDRIDAEAQGFLRPQATPFIGFESSGRPRAQSLGGLRQEGI